MDSKATVGELRDLVARFVNERDWEKFHNPKDLAAALSVEAGELLEHFLWEGQGTARITAKNEQEIKEELADVAIYCLSFANAQGWDLSDAIEEKVRKNRQKYPPRKYRGVARLP